MTRVGGGRRGLIGKCFVTRVVTWVSSNANQVKKFIRRRNQKIADLANLIGFAKWLADGELLISDICWDALLGELGSVVVLNRTRASSFISGESPEPEEASVKATANTTQGTAYTAEPFGWRFANVFQAAHTFYAQTGSRGSRQVSTFQNS